MHIYWDPSEALSTVMRIIKLKLYPAPVRLHSGSGKLKFRRYFTIFCDI